MPAQGGPRHGRYLSTGLIALWAGITVRQQGTLVCLLALGVLLAGAPYAGR